MSTIVDRLNALSKKQLIALICEYSKDEKTSAIADKSAPSSEKNYRDNDIAIVGMSCRFPGAVNSCEELWELIVNKQVAITDSPNHRWDLSNYLGNEDEKDKTYTMSTGLVDDIDQFDAGFFNLSAREAETMDPQQRLALEQIWHALESAGIPIADCENKNYGVFLGVGANEYMNFCRHHARQEDAGYIASGNVLNMIPGRAAYLLGVHGPVMAIDTACSSSLSAVHSAVNSLRKGECSLAIAGGINVLLDPENFVSLAQAKMLSPTGRCHTFDKNADGYVRSEGCGIVILKKISEAMADNDNILAVIRGSAMSHNGHSASITAPSKKAQQQVINQALKDAQIQAEDIDLVEAHGTGTALGDPIELHAIDAVFGHGNKRREKQLHISSIKSNIGHAEAAAGIAGLIKMVLALRHKVIPPQANFSQLNPNIHLENDFIEIATESKVWPELNKPRTCGISSFGFSGVNLHVVLEEFSRVDIDQPINTISKSYILTLSAKSKKSLVHMAQNYLQMFEKESCPNIESLCYTASVHKDHHPLRLSVLGSNRNEMQGALQQVLATLNEGDVEGDSRRDRPLILTGEKLFSPKLFLALSDSFESFKKVIENYNTMFSALDIADVDSLEKYLEVYEKSGNVLNLDAEKERAIAVLMGAVFLKWLNLLLPKLRKSSLYVDGLMQLSVLVWLFDVNPAVLLEKKKENNDENDLSLPKNIHFTCVDKEQLVFNKGLLERIVNMSSSNTTFTEISSGNELINISAIDDANDFSKQLSILYEAQYEIQWKYAYGDKTQLIETPLYPYDRSRYWVNGGPVLNSKNSTDEIVIENIRIKKVAHGSSDVQYRFAISSVSPHLIDDHRLFNRVVVPGSFYLSCVCRLFREQYPVGKFSLDNVQFKKALTLNEKEERLLIITINEMGESHGFDWVVESQGDQESEPVKHCYGQSKVFEERENSNTALNLDEIQQSWRTATQGDVFYKDFAEKGYTLGPFFRYVSDGWINKNTILRKVWQPKETINDTSWELHPGVLDSLFQVAGGLEELNFDKDKIFIPYEIKQFYLYQSQHNSPYFWCLVHVNELNAGQNSGQVAGDAIRVNFSIYDHKQQLCLQVNGFELRAISRATVEKSLQIRPLFYKEIWQEANFSYEKNIKDVKEKELILLTLSKNTSSQNNTLSGCFLPSLKKPFIANNDGDIHLTSVEDITASIDENIRLRSEGGGKSLHFVWHISFSSSPLSEVGDESAPQEIFVLYHLLKRLTEESPKGRSVRLLLLISSQGELARIYGKMLVSVLRCFRQEQESIACKVVSIDEYDSFAEQMSNHIDSVFKHAESEFSYKDNALLVRRLSYVLDSELVMETDPSEKTASGNMNHVLITGATGGVGQQLARHLVNTCSIQSLTLLGSRQKDTAIEQLLQDIRQCNVEAHYYALDLSSQKQIIQFTQKLSHNSIEVDTVFHAAAILQDALIDNVDRAQIEKSFAIKCASITCLLNRLPSIKNLVNFSSMAASVGSAGQSVYAASNSYLDALVDCFKNEDLNIFSINWGPWDQLGMAARLSEQHKDVMLSKGIRSFSANDAFALLDKVLLTQERHLTVADLDPATLIKSLPKTDRHLFLGVTAVDGDASEGELLKDSLTGLSEKEVFNLLYAFICSTVSEIVRTEVKKIEQTEAGFFNLGMDSLMILEFRKIIEKELSVKVESSVIFNYPNPKKLTSYLVTKMKPEKEDESASVVFSSIVEQGKMPMSSHRDLDTIAAELEKELEL